MTWKLNAGGLIQLSWEMKHSDKGHAYFNRLSLVLVFSLAYHSLTMKIRVQIIFCLQYDKTMQTYENYYNA